MTNEEKWRVGNNWKGESASESAKHKWLVQHFGKPNVCENPFCRGKSIFFDWCLKKGMKHSHNRTHYLRLCRQCHRKYDITEEGKQQAIGNLWWNNNRITGNAVLDVNMVREIRELFNGNLSYPDIARIYGVNKSTIGLIKRGITWKNLT